jgi:hypothetical protein
MGQIRKDLLNPKGSFLAFSTLTFLSFFGYELA